MKDIIANIDTGQVNARMDVINTKLDEALDYSEIFKNGLRDDIVRLEKIIDKVEDDIHEVETKTRTQSTMLKQDLIQSVMICLIQICCLQKICW